MHHMEIWVMAAGRVHNADVSRWHFCNEVWKSKTAHDYLYPQANFTLDQGYSMHLICGQDYQIINLKGAWWVVIPEFFFFFFIL